MSSLNRRAAARRRAWGRGPTILRFEPLEGRQLMATDPTSAPMPDLVATTFDTVHNLDWGDPFHAVGTIKNQGDAPASAPFRVDVYASSTLTINQNAVKLGSINVPAGLAPGATYSFDQVESLPPTALAGMGTFPWIYVSLRVDPSNSVGEGNLNDKAGLGQGIDTSAVAITPHQDSNLVGKSFSVDPVSATWGGTLNLTAVVKNDAQGNAPATRARIVLTPAGSTPGGSDDLTIGNLDVPALPGWQTVKVSQSITLPAPPPPSLAGASQFTVSMIQDADYQADPVGPHHASQGPGLDSATIAIASTTAANPAASTLPDLTPTAVSVSAASPSWGQGVQIAATVKNQGAVDSGPVRVRFLLTAADGSEANSLFLGDATIPIVKANDSQAIVQTIKLPGRAPDGFTLETTGHERIVVRVDPENTVAESNKTNNALMSNPITLKLVDGDGLTTIPPQTTTSTPASATSTQTTQTSQTTQTKQTATPKEAKPAGTIQAGQTTQSAKTARPPTTPKQPAPRPHRFPKPKPQPHHLQIFTARPATAPRGRGPKK